jgi:DNA primase
VIVVEGYMDVVALAQHGVANAVATLGTATTPFHVQKLLRQADRVTFCFDGDAAGRRAAWRALETSLEALSDGKHVNFLFLPEKDDPDSFVRTEGPDAFRSAMNRALPLAEFLLAELKKDIDLGTAEGCARLVHEAKPLVTRIGAPLLRLQVIKMLAETAGFTQAEVEQSFGLKNASAQPRRFDDAPPFDGNFERGGFDRDFGGGFGNNRQLSRQAPARRRLSSHAATPGTANRRRNPAQAGRPAPALGRPPAHRPAAPRHPGRPGPDRAHRRHEHRRAANPRHWRPARALPGNTPRGNSRPHGRPTG